MGRWQHAQSRLRRRVQREWHLRQELASRTVWDYLRPQSLAAELRKSLLYSCNLPSTVPSSDPILADPALPGDPMAARHHYVYHVEKKAYLEPDYGYTILEPHSLVDEAFARADCLRDPDRNIYYPGAPSLAKLILAKRGAYPVRKEQVVVSLRGGFDDNIYHVFSDVLPRLSLLDEQGIDPSIPIVISPTLQKVVRALGQYNDLSERKWLVQKGFYIEADEVIFARADDATKDQIDHILNTANLSPSIASHEGRKLFITRTADVGRNVSNMDEIVPILRQFDFEIIDPAVLTIGQQIAVFSQARTIVGLHGAGLTNIVYRGNGPLRMLEIFPPYRVPLCFYAIAKKYGFEYDYIIGSGTPSNKLGMKYSYHLDPILLHDKLVHLCKAAS